MKKTLTLFLFAAWMPLVAAMAQAPAPAAPPPGPRPTWTADLPGGTYIVLLSAITSVSFHEYIVDGAARVTEVNVNTPGPDLVRFYYIEPNAPEAPDGVGQSAIDLLQEKTEAVLARAGTDEVWRKVVKNYPTTTHSGTVEYRLGSRETLLKLFDSARDAWISQKSGIFKLKP